MAEPIIVFNFSLTKLLLIINYPSLKSAGGFKTRFSSGRGTKFINLTFDSCGGDHSVGNVLFLRKLRCHVGRCGERIWIFSHQSRG